MTEQVQLSFSSSVDAEIAWVVTGLRLTEQLNQPYVLKLAISTDVDAEPVNQLGASVSVLFERGESQREICGIVTSAVDGQRGEEETTPATLTIVPALEALRHRRNSKIFPDQSIKDTLHEVLEPGLAAYGRTVDDSFLTGSYPIQEYTVQYQETDFAFVHRLLEEYGIGYMFTVVDGAEQLVLFDSDDAYVALSSLNNEDGVLPLILLEGGAEDQEDCREFARKLQLRLTVARPTVFDWAKPAELIDSENAEANAFEVPDGAALEPEREDYEHIEPATVFGFRSAGLDAAEVDNQVLLRHELHRRDAMTFPTMAVGRERVSSLYARSCHNANYRNNDPVFRACRGSLPARVAKNLLCFS